jgi:hypothetical protein
MSQPLPPGADRPPTSPAPATPASASTLNPLVPPFHSSGASSFAPLRRFLPGCFTAPPRRQMIPLGWRCRRSKARERSPCQCQARGKPLRSPPSRTPRVDGRCPASWKQHSVLRRIAFLGVRTRGRSAASQILLARTSTAGKRSSVRSVIMLGPCATSPYQRWWQGSGRLDWALLQLFQ